MGFKMIKTVLVPTDGSACANRALMLAVDLAKTYNANIIIIHVVPDASIPQIGDYEAYSAAEHQRLGDALTGLGERILRKAEGEARGYGAGNVRSLMPSGSAAQKIVKAANDHSVDLIVMGRHGNGEFTELLLGSVSQKVLHAAKCNCLLVR
jgi:nucleotide-binding universal stress UspA family protein